MRHCPRSCLRRRPSGRRDLKERWPSDRRRQRTIRRCRTPSGQRSPIRRCAHPGQPSLHDIHRQQVLSTPSLPAGAVLQIQISPPRSRVPRQPAHRAPTSPAPNAPARAHQGRRRTPALELSRRPGRGLRGRSSTDAGAPADHRAWARGRRASGWPARSGTAHRRSRGGRSRRHGSMVRSMAARSRSISSGPTGSAGRRGGLPRMRWGPRRTWPTTSVAVGSHRPCRRW